MCLSHGWKIFPEGKGGLWNNFLFQEGGGWECVQSLFLVILQCKFNIFESLNFPGEGEICTPPFKQHLLTQAYKYNLI